MGVLKDGVQSDKIIISNKELSKEISNKEINNVNRQSNKEMNDKQLSNKKGDSISYIPTTHTNHTSYNIYTNTTTNNYP